MHLKRSHYASSASNLLSYCGVSAVLMPFLPTTWPVLGGWSNFLSQNNGRLLFHWTVYSWLQLPHSRTTWYFNCEVITIIFKYFFVGLHHVHRQYNVQLTVICCVKAQAYQSTHSLTTLSTTYKHLRFWYDFFFPLYSRMVMSFIWIT